jgi:DNA-binding transcriptional regulator YdaS (Cro superfamily)
MPTNGNSTSKRRTKRPAIPAWTPKGIPALHLAILLLGSQTRLGQVVGVSQSTVSWVALYGRQVPERWCIPIRRATRGRVKEGDLRPDLFGKVNNKRLTSRNVQALTGL